MSDWSRLDRSHVLAAIAECDRLGAREFLSRYSFGRAKASAVWHHGQEYDSKALLGVALLHATGRPATKDDFSMGEAAVSRLLSGLGFDVVVDEEALEAEDRAAASRALGAEAAATASPSRAAGGTVRAPAASRKKPAARKTVKKVARPNLVDQPAQLCPTCFMALPLTGVCDSCD